ncbi:MAG: hypothetical protein ACK5C3_00915, partial [bacterium]
PRVRSRPYPCCAGVVAHDTRCDLRHPTLRLRCAPPSWAHTRAEREQVGEKVAKRIVWHHLW